MSRRGAPEWRNSSLPREWRCTPTWKRRANLFLNRWEYMRRTTRLRSRPWVLQLEPTSGCNLRCPFCFTGAGGIGRAPSTLSLELVDALLEELGDYLILVHLCGWGEPLLCRHLSELVKRASARGICTAVNTSFSLPFSRERADELVQSGLDHLIVSIDGSRQESYERYRVKGSLERVVENVGLVNEAKQRRGRDKPELVLEFHPFPWNVNELGAMHEMARQLGMTLRVYKGCVPGADWDGGEELRHCIDPVPMPCHFLWTTLVVGSDGGVKPCTGTFYAEDDFGRLEPNSLAGRRFRKIWNGERLQHARSLFRARRGDAEQRRRVCFECPATTLWERWERHVNAGGSESDFEIGFTTNDAWNYFWNRRPAGALRHHADPASGGELVGTPPIGEEHD